MSQEVRIGGGVIDDEARIGKTVQMIAYGLISEMSSRKRRDYNANRPTLVVVPHMLLEKTVDEVNNYIGVGRKTFVLGDYPA